ncbi:S8 family serine peptidase [Actinomadura rudentiformis]|uniref:S8 family serine peptidase n=1 Tax=Actinomadura rudentiformis TaxID=359158 RepID=A0A6H9Z190_9ACTN|nr:S8 family serine peptidase [Actinomadura rudentiformis]KAB2347834.1 S8 family serine peptidase [Actinomadura rudentiformis]
MTRFLAAAGASSLLALTVATPAGAVPGPRSEQWWFSAWEIQKKVWPVSQGAGVTVAVIDTGVNASLPEFQGAVVPGADLERGSGDGRTDTDTKLGGHGTGMAALIASQGGRTGFVGVAPQAKILPIIADSHEATTKGIRYAVDHGAKVISISQGHTASQGCEPNYQQAISYALQKDAVVVVSAGNSGNASNRPESPANCAGVLAVGAVDNKKKAWIGTQRQPYVAVAAPGAPVTSVGKEGRLVGDVIGTSQAAALTSAVAALVRSKHPQMSNREVVQRIIASAVDAGPPGMDNMTGAGVIIPERALNANVPKSAPNPVFDRFDRLPKAPPGQTGAAQTPDIAEPKNNDTRNSIITLVIALGGILGVLLLAVVIFVFARRGGKGGPPSGGYGGGPGAGPGQQAGGPPPGWGAGSPRQSGGFPTPPQGPPGQQGPPPGYRG